MFMSMGTKSVLFGAHCFLLHPLFVAIAWTRVYGLPRDWRLLPRFFVHDLGYAGKRNMDGPEGEEHVHFGAAIMRRLCGRKWEEFTRSHSRYWAKKTGRPYSRLCVADKLAFVLTPLWLYIPMTRWTGELAEYMRRAVLARRHSESRALGSTVSPVWRRAQFSGRFAFVHKPLGRTPSRSGRRSVDDRA
jgi:hypothetical protein